MPIIDSIWNKGILVEDTYPVFVRAVRRLMSRVGIYEPPRLAVSDLFAGKHAIALIEDDSTIFNNEIAAMGDHPVAISAAAHETAHILTQTRPPSEMDWTHFPKASLNRHKKMELRMDRLTTMMMGEHQPVLDMRTWIERSIDPVLSSKTFLGRMAQRHDAWKRREAYHAKYGSWHEIVSNIKRVDLRDTSELETAVAEYNARKSVANR